MFVRSHIAIARLASVTLLGIGAVSACVTHQPNDEPMPSPGPVGVGGTGVVPAAGGTSGDLSSGGSVGSGGGSSFGAGGDNAGAGGSTTTVAPGVPLEGWTYRRAVALNTSATGANVLENVPGYPVPLMLDATNFDFTQAGSAGQDLRFSTNEGALLPYEIEYFNATEQMAAVWVKLDVLGNSATQSFTMHWGNPAASDASDSAAVFDSASGFAAVWHLSETGNTTSGGYRDSTANAAHATGVSLDAGSVTAGPVGRATSLSHASGQYIELQGSKNDLFEEISNNITFSVWVHSKSHGVNYQCAFSRGEGGFRLQYYGAANWCSPSKHIVEPCLEAAECSGSCDSCVVVGCYASNSDVSECDGTSVAPGQWWHLMGVGNNGSQTLYVNGAEEFTCVDGRGFMDKGQNVTIGTNTSYKTDRSWDGYIDEARILHVAKDANYAKLEYESQKPGQVFSSFGDTHTN